MTARYQSYIIYRPAILFLLAISFLLFSAKKSFAEYLTDAQCTAKGGTCNAVFNTCNYDEDSLGLCQGGPLSQGACCKKKSSVSTGYLTDAQCTAKGGTCNWVFNSCNAVDEESVGLCQGGATSQGACCKKITTNTGVDATTPDKTNIKIGTTNPVNVGTTTPAGIGTTTAAGVGTTTSSGARTGSTGGLVPCTDDCTLCHLVVGIKNIFDYLLYTVLAPLFILGIVVSGVLYMVSSGSKGLTEKAKTALTYSLTGFVIALTAWLMVNFVMLTLGFKNPLGGSWYNFTCDTSQSKTAASSTTTGTTGTTGTTTTGTGTCGGISTSGNATGQCSYASSQLSSVLSCIKGKMAYAPSKNLGFSNLFSFVSGAKPALAASGVNISSFYRPQSGNSCHAGGRNCSGETDAADLTGDMASAKEAAIACGADTVIYQEKAYAGGKTYTGASDHYDHVHISVNNKKCGCDYLK